MAFGFLVTLARDAGGVGALSADAAAVASIASPAALAPAAPLLLPALAPPSSAITDSSGFVALASAEVSSAVGADLSRGVVPLGLLPPRDVTLPPVPVAGLLPAGSLPATTVGFLDAAAAVPPAVVEAPAADPPLLGGPADLAPFLGAVAPRQRRVWPPFRTGGRNPPNPAKPISNR